MRKQASRIDVTLGELDRAGVMIWGRQKYPKSDASGWFWAPRDAAKLQPTAADGQSHPGIHGPFPTAVAAGTNALQHLAN